ncbi:hypothetical protein ACFLYN_03980 [Chloroflexota bacterium]
MYKVLYILLEGSDDGRFFERIVKPLFKDMYDHVGIWEYAKKRPEKTRRFIRSICAMLGNYIYVTDINQSPCITHRKSVAKNKLINNIDDANILVVKKEIESWYLAGLDEVCCRKYRIPHFNTTDNITKEQFNNLIPSKFKSSRIAFLQEILEYHQVDIAKQKNESFEYLLHKHVKNK